MSERSQAVLTIGHSTHALPTFFALLRQHRVRVLADVRFVPYSRFNPQFNREPLAEALVAQGVHYVYLGDALGGRSEDPACYENGRIRYDRLAATDLFKDGLNRIVRGAVKCRIVLMCAEKEPLHCHRTLLVSRALDEQGLDIAHIHADGLLETHGRAMDRLLDILKLPREDLYHTHDELIATAVARQSKRVAYVNDKLAARTEEQAP